MAEMILPSPTGVSEPVASMDMVWIPGGEFRMGSDDHYPEERPVHRVHVDGFWIDRHLITNAEFRRFIEATRYVTLAEKAPTPAGYPGANKGRLEPGSLVFVKPSGPVDLSDFRNWWKWVPGADWRHPRGPNSTIIGREEHPVVQVALEDVEAYAKWASKDLPTEAEWEFAARGGLEGASYAWGEELTPRGRFMANFWQGDFPWHNARSDGFEGTSPVGSFPPNGYGLVDMIGNVWEWTADWYSPRHPGDTAMACRVPHNSRGGEQGQSYEDGQPAIRIPRRVLKGGSHLCAPNYSRRYRPAARYAHPADTSTCDVGFRCIVRAPERE